jgi:hypothetical protein
MFCLLNGEVGFPLTSVVIIIIIIITVTIMEMLRRK